jgi:hypothetical protein
MQVVKRKQINSEIGKNGVFKSYPSLHEKLRYVEGISGFDPLPRNHRQGNVISLIGHPEGIEIRENASGSMVALPYSKIKSWDILEYKEDRHYLHIHLHHQKDIVFNFLVNAGTDIAKYFNQIKIDRFKEERSEDLIKEQIGYLVDAWALPADYHVNFSQEFKTAALGKTKRIEITDNRISWGGEAFELHNATAITYSKTQNNVNGFKTSMNYEIHVHLTNRKKPLKIVFGKAFGVGEKQAELFYGNILDALFNLVTRKQIQSWLIAFKNNERVECQDFSVSREGIHHVRRGENKLIKWGEIAIDSFEMTNTFKSAYEKRNAVSLSLNYHPQAWAMISFCEFLRDGNNLRLLVG